MSFYNGILNHDDNHESGQRGLPGVGFKVDADGNYDIENKKLTNVKNGDMDHDVMVKSQIEGYVSNKTQYLDGVNPGEVKPNKAAIYSSSGGLHGNSFYIKDRYGQEVKLHTEDQDDNQIRLYIPNLKNNDSFGGRLKSSIMITSIDQSIQGKKLFHNIEVPTPTSDTQASNKKYVDTNFVAKSGDTMLGPLVVQKDNYPIQGDLNKVISYETQREIFLSKKEGGRMEQPIDMGGFTIENLKLPTANDHACNKYYIDHNFLNRFGGEMGGDLDMRGHSIKYLKLDNADHSAARVAEMNLKADKSDLDDYFKLDGSKAMTDNLNMNNNRILRLPDPLLSDEPATKGYVSQLNNNLFNNYLDLQGIRKMEGNLNMNNHMITNVKTPLNDSDAVNKGYLDNHSIQPAHPQKNALDYIMDDVDQTSSEYGIEIDKIDNYNDSFHSYNKKVIYLKLLKDGNNYRSRIGYNIFKLIDKSKDRYYTAVIEWLTTDNNVWNKMEIFNNITSGSIILNQTRKFEDGKGLYYTRSIIQFEVMAISTSPLYLLSTIHIDGVNPTYPAKFSEVYNIIYGIDGSHTTISPIVFDYHNTYDIKNNKMTMNVDVDMNNKAIKNISNLSMEGLISIYGTVDRSKYFIAPNVNVPLNFRKIYISYIRIYGTHETRSKSDTLKIEDRLGNENWYPFRFHHIGGMVHIGINRYFEVIRSIKLTNTTNIAFLIRYAFFINITIKYTMPYVLDQNDNHILDENGNKIEFSISYLNTNDWYKHKEGIHINIDNHLDTEDRHIIVKEGIDDNHAVCKKQLDQLYNKILSTLQDSITKSITAKLQIHEAKILAQMLNFRNEQVKIGCRENTSLFRKHHINGSNCLTIRTLAMMLLI